MKTYGFGNAICDIENHSNPNGLLDFLRTENDVSRTMQIISVFGRKSMKTVNQASDFAMKTQGFRNAILVFQNVEFHKGLLDFLRTENDVQKTLCFISEMEWNFIQKVNRAVHFAMKTQGFRNAIFVFQNVELYNGLLDFLETENDALETLCFIREMTRPVCYFHGFSSNYAYETQGFWNAICDIEKP